MRFLMIILFIFSASNAGATEAEDDFRLWLAAFQQEAIGAGITPKTAMRVTEHIQFIPKVITLDRAQPEFVSTFFDYYRKRVDALKIQRGKEALVMHALILDKVEAQYGVPKETLVAFWGMETNYGSFKGNIDTFSTLATLAYEGRRARFFRSQLLDAMYMVDIGHADVEDLHESLHGSWAGAFGHMQFMPSTFVSFAVDGDNDGVVDISNSIPDALASAGNYLSQVGWQMQQPAMIEVKLPENFAWQNAQLLLRKSVQEWADLGVVALFAAEPSQSLVQLNQKARQNQRQIKVATSNASTLTARILETKPLNKAVNDMQLPAAILLPQGWQGPAFMVFSNFDVMMDWNRSVHYALSVAQLAKRINGEVPVLGGQFAETEALSFQEMFDVQTILNARGFDSGEADGFPGLQTQAAVRAYQLSQNLPADGYASPKLLAHLYERR